MNKSTYFKNLARKLVEASLREADENTPELEKEDSIDSQVDRYLAQFEVEAKASQNEGNDFRSLTRRLLSEAEDDEESGDSTEDIAKLTTEDIDMSSFVNGVIRLIDNYDNLLEVRNTLLRRAKNFLLKSYDQKVVESFEDALLDDHGIEIGLSKKSTEEDHFSPPPGDHAGGGGSSGAT